MEIWRCVPILRAPEARRDDIRLERGRGGGEGGGCFFVGLAVPRLSRGCSGSWQSTLRGPRRHALCFAISPVLARVLSFKRQETCPMGVSVRACLSLHGRLAGTDRVVCFGWEAERGVCLVGRFRRD